MVTKEQVAAAAAEARDASAAYAFARSIVAAAYEAEERPRKRRARGPISSIRSCVAIGAAVQAGIEAIDKCGRLAEAVEELAAAQTDLVQAQTFATMAARARKNAFLVERRLCMDAAVFIADCPDLADKLGMVAIAVAQAGAGSDA
jgi:hypothetical protein